MTAAAGLATRRIPAQAYEALADALSVMWWNKSPFEMHLRIALHDHPEILARLDFSQPKRAVAGAVAHMLSQDGRYIRATLKMMADLAQTLIFPNLAIQADADQLITRAKQAVANLNQVACPYLDDLDDQRQVTALFHQGTESARAAHNFFASSLADIKAKFVALEIAPDPQQRGRDFEKVLYRLLDLFDMQPRMAYNLPHEQIDGSFTFDTDDFLLEAKWCKARPERDQADIFAAKVQRKGRNTLGLFVSVTGFTQGFLTAPHAHGCPFITLDGDDLYLILDGRADLSEALRQKRRHLNDTGICHLPVRVFGI